MYTREAMNGWILIDIAVPWNKNIGKAEQMKMQKYQDLVGQMGEIYQTEANIASLVSGGTLRTISRNLCRMAWR